LKTSAFFFCVLLTGLLQTMYLQFQTEWYFAIKSDCIKCWRKLDNYFVS